MQKTILFLGATNTTRSQIAEGIARNITQDPLLILSAGGNPGQEVHPLVIKIMNELNIDISDQKPKKFHPEMLLDVDQTIYLGDDVKEAFDIPMQWNSFLKWDIEPLENKSEKEFQDTRDLLMERIESFLKSWNIHIKKTF